MFALTSKAASALAATLLGSLLVTQSAIAQNADPIDGGGDAKLSIELNGAADQNGACRLTFVANNALSTEIEALSLETVLFDKAGKVVLFTLFDFGSLPANRLRVRQFDVAQTACDSLGRALINGVAVCSVEGDVNQCAKALEVSSSSELELLQ